MVAMKMRLLLLALSAASGAQAAQDRRLLPLLRHPRQAAEVQVAAAVDTEDQAPGTADEAAPAEVAATTAAAPATQAPLSGGNFPKLPDVKSMLGSAAHTLEGLTSQAEALQKQIAQAQADKVSNMARQKAAFEEKLKKQEMASRELVSENAEVRKDIAKLESDNDGLRHRAKALQDSNAVMRQELTTLGAKLGQAKEFVVAAMHSTDDSRAKDLKVLSQKWEMPVVTPKEAQKAVAQTPPKVRSHSSLAKVAAKSQKTSTKEADDDEDDDDDDDDNATSFLAIESHRRIVGDTPADVEAEAKAHQMIKVLQDGVKTLSTQESASEAQLKQLFVAQFKAGAQRYSALAQEQMQLNATRASLTTLKADLEKAEMHLKDTKKHLNTRLHELGQYLQKLAHLALAPVNSAQPLLKALPQDVEAKTAPDSATGGQPAADPALGGITMA